MKSRLIFWHTIIPSVVNAWLLDKLDCKALYQTKKETLSRRPFQAQVASSLILMHATPNRGPPSNRYRDGDIGESFASSEEVIPKRCKPPPPAKRSVTHLPMDVRQDMVAHFPGKTKRGRCRHCLQGYTARLCSKCKVRHCFTGAKNCFVDYNSKRTLSKKGLHNVKIWFGVVSMNSHVHKTIMMIIVWSLVM